MKLYGYWRSGAAYRVRIALALKGVAFETVPVHLLRGEQAEASFLALNPQGRVPILVLDDGAVLSQSPAILEWLEETHPDPSLLPADPVGRAKARALAALIACDTHPLHNVGPLAYLRGELACPEPAVLGWARRWIGGGLAAVEAQIGDDGFCLGPEPGLADVYLVPQLYAAERYGVALEGWPRIRRVAALAAQHPAFAGAHPSQQPDAE